MPSCRAGSGERRGRRLCRGNRSLSGERLRLRDRHQSRVRVEPADEARRQAHRRRANKRRWPAMTTTTLTAQTTRRARFGRFMLHFFEMCAPMCVGFAIGDLIYFWAAGRFGYSEPFKELPELSVVVVTFTMTAPMIAWKVYRG